MGDRAFVVCKSGEDYAPAVYLHWDGSHVPQLLKEAAPRMRKGDQHYAAARFCGHCHEQIKGGLSPGILPPPKPDDNGKIDWDAYADGDNGVFVVDVDTGQVIQEAVEKPMKPFHIKMGDF